MRLKWWSAMLLLPRKWLFGYMLSIVGALQGLLYNANWTTYLDFYDFLKQVLLMSLGGGLKLYEILMRYIYIFYCSMIKHMQGEF